MRLRVLGCSGGVGEGTYTTSFLIDDDIMLDAGSGIGTLTTAEMARLRHVLLTHSHLDHICFLPQLVDSAFEELLRYGPLQIHALPATIDALRTHIFNRVIWPDFTALPTREHPVMVFSPLQIGETMQFGGRRFTMIPAEHPVPAVGYLVQGERETLAFSGDCGCNDVLWERLNQEPDLTYLIVDLSFPADQEALAKVSGHYTGPLLAEDLKKLRHRPQLWATHHVPGLERQILQECRQRLTDREINSLVAGMVIEVA